MEFMLGQKTATQPSESIENMRPTDLLGSGSQLTDIVDGVAKAEGNGSYFYTTFLRTIGLQDDLGKSLLKRPPIPPPKQTALAECGFWFFY